MLGARTRAVIAAVTLFMCGTTALQNAVANGDTRTLYLLNMNTGEGGTFTFKREGRYDEAVLKKLNWFLRDWRRDEPTNMDPQLFDLVWEVYRDVGASESIHVVSGYRSPQTNSMLRSRSKLVAEQSQHMRGKAMDFYIPGVSITDLRVLGLRMQRGGVGFYPTANTPFVHMDTGGVRHWPRMTHDQLVRVFPDEKTVHIPSDGKPLANYKVALAELEARGGTAGGPDEEDFGSGLKNFFAALFGGGRKSAEPSGAEDMSPAEVKAAARNAAKGGTQVASVGPAQGGAYVASADDDDTSAAPSSAPAAAPARADAGRAGARIAATPVPLPIRAPQPKVTTVALAPAPLPSARPAEIAAAIVTAQAVLAPLPNAPLPLRRPSTADASLQAADPIQTASIPPLPAVITRGTGTPEGALSFAPSGDMIGGAPNTILSPNLQPMPQRPRERARTAEVPFGRVFTAHNFSFEPYMRAPEMRVMTQFMTAPKEVVATGFSADPTAGLSTNRFSGPAIAAIPVYAFAPSSVRLTQRLQ
ncbi:DUF882 domain-containing protein [Aquabacter sp. L1I39]|uniref:DUF882 domain-containing protein n=1 Tax=Aquabacter sp. L1I39 TaxID=2820278 RepID=UPI001ADA012C|nr:DUF882 domain-containing protein [Aquabacter sp. L1I39]QTL02749.1 DUF882 domain-containing protein [Aquabacter sp. L1I39]